MQKAKDSFFAELRDRLATINSERTVEVEGESRPGILVCENEKPGFDAQVSDVFCLEWGDPQPVCASVDGAPVAMQCTISYGTRGSSEGGLDRGRVLAQMEAELRQMLSPSFTEKTDYTTEQPTPLDSTIFWELMSMSAPELEADTATGTTVVKVFYYREAQA